MYRLTCPGLLDYLIFSRPRETCSGEHRGPYQAAHADAGAGTDSHSGTLPRFTAGQIMRRCRMNPKSGNAPVRPFEAITAFALQTDVLVCGYGGAGTAAALEAAAGGARVMILERASAGGGSTAMSSCEMYLGGSGGTALQRDLGLEDSTDNMLAYLRAALGPHGDEEKIHCYAQGAAAHFDWVEALGVPYKRAAFLERTVVPLTDESLLYTGNEKSHPFNTVAAPVPRGHVPSKEGDEGGRIFMDAIMRHVTAAGVEVVNDCRLVALLADAAGAIRGAVARLDNREVAIRAERAVILTTGGFVMNETMTRQYLPEIHAYAVPYGNTYDLGDGIALA